MDSYLGTKSGTKYGHNVQRGEGRGTYIIWTLFTNKLVPYLSIMNDS